MKNAYDSKKDALLRNFVWPCYTDLYLDKVIKFITYLKKKMYSYIYGIDVICLTISVNIVGISLFIHVVEVDLIDSHEILPKWSNIFFCHFWDSWNGILWHSFELLLNGGNIYIHIICLCLCVGCAEQKSVCAIYLIM